MHLAVQALSIQHIQHGSVQLRGSYRHLFVLQGGATSRYLPPTSASDQIGLGLQLVSSAPMANLKQFSIVPPFYSTLKIILLFNSVCPDKTHAQETQLLMYTYQLREKFEWFTFLQKL